MTNIIAPSATVNKAILLYSIFLQIFEDIVFPHNATSAKTKCYLRIKSKTETKIIHFS